MVDAVSKRTPRTARKTPRGAHDAAVGPLRGRVPGLLPAQADALRDFFAASQYWALRDGGTLYFAPGAPGMPGGTFTLEGDGVPLGLDLESDDDRNAGGGPHWSDYGGRSRMLAWSLAHESQLMRLSDGLGVALIPVDAPSGEDADADADADAQLWLDFAIDDAGIEESAPASHRGKLRLPYTWLPRLLDRAEQPFVDDPLPALGRWRDLSAPVAIQLAGPQLNGAEWRALRPGDVIVVGTRTKPLQLSARGAGSDWPLAATPEGWRVDGAARPIPSANRESPVMSDNNETSATPVPTGAGIDEDAGARSLPVKVEFEIGQVEMSVGELSTLQPGYVFALPSHLEGANVTIRANGRVSGRGEVVAVGETLGVRLLSWS